MANEQQINLQKYNQPQNKKTAADWVRDLRFSNLVNQSTLGVDTDRVTPLLLMAASNKLLKISRGLSQGDAKDSLQYQRFYGPVEYFALHIQKDAGSVARSMLWKATNKGNLDSIPLNALQSQISSVFNGSLAQFVDNSTPMDSVDNAMKVTRVGEGGVSSEDQVPILMRLVQPSYLGYIDPSRTNLKSPGVTGYVTKNIMKGTDGKLYRPFYNTKTKTIDMVDSQTAAKSVITTALYKDSKDPYVFAVGGLRGVRVVPYKDVNYILPYSDLMFSMSANAVPMASGIKGMRLLMGCLHPDTTIVFADLHGYTDIIPVKLLGSSDKTYLMGCDNKGNDLLQLMSQIVPRFPDNKRKFRRVILKSGRVLNTSPDHKWSVYADNEFKLIKAELLLLGMKIPRSLFLSMPVRLTDILGITITKLICVFLGCLLRSLLDSGKVYRFSYIKEQEDAIDKAIIQLSILGFNKYLRNGILYISLTDLRFLAWLDKLLNLEITLRRVPKAVLSLPLGYTALVLDAYSKDKKNLGLDNQGDIWLIDIPSCAMRDGLSFMLNKIYTDTVYHDFYLNGVLHRALLLIPAKTTMGDIVLDLILYITMLNNPGIMIDIDCNDNVYACANGIITHNSKYTNQAVSLQLRLASLVQSLDEASGKPIDQIIGKHLGTSWAPKAGIVQAVRKDRVDMLYDDGTKGSIPLYLNFPSNTKGWITSYPKVKAGLHIDKDQLVASSNYTDDKGVAALGRNLRVAYLSYKGGSYLDGCALSLTAAKKLGYTTMYQTSMDLNKTIRNNKNLYHTWKPDQYKKLQMLKLGDDGIVKVGQVLLKGDPMILGIQTTLPSPGTLGKRLLTDVTQLWLHHYPGVVTDIARTKSGIKVLATVSQPLRAGDKISGYQGNKATCYSPDTQVLTLTGWKYFILLKDTDKVAALQLDGTAKFLSPSDIQLLLYHGLLMGYKSKSLNWLVTPDHAMWASTINQDQTTGEYTFSRKPMQLIYGNKVMHRVAAVFQDHPDCEYTELHVEDKQYKWKTDDFAKFLGLYLACGYISDELHIILTLADTDSYLLCDKILALLKDMNLNVGKTSIHYVISNKVLYTYLMKSVYSTSSYIPQLVFTDWSHRQQQLLLDWFNLGNNPKDQTEEKIIVTSKQLVSDLQRLYTLCGYHVIESNPDWNEDLIKQNPFTYQLTLCKNQYRQSEISDNKDCIDIAYYTTPYTGKVYCCTVSTGVIYVQRDGHPMWCGNCARVIPDDQMPKDLKGRPILLLFDPLGVVSRCYDKQTEFLTKDGWKFGKDILESDLLYSFDPETSSGLWSKQLLPIYKKLYKGTMYGAKTRDIDFLVTTGHRFWAKTEDSLFNQKTVNLIFGKQCIVPCAVKLKLSADFAVNQDIASKVLFLGWYFTDENTIYKQEDKSRYYINSSIILTNLETIDQLQALLAIHGQVSVKYKLPKSVYKLKISTNQKTTKSVSEQSWYTLLYNDYVYCPTVRTGYVLTRRNGKLLIAHNTNPSQMMLAALGKVAEKTGKTIIVPQFSPYGQSRLLWTKQMLKQYNVPYKETLTDPLTGRKISNVFTGVNYFLPLKHIADTKMSARGTALYTSLGIPASSGLEGSKRIGGLESAALIGHNAFDFLVTDAKLIRGQSNADFWRSIRTGTIPVIPGLPLVHRKFFNHLIGSGMNIQKNTQGISIFALTNKDVDKLAGNRLLKSRDTYLQKNFRPIDGGLFGQDLFGDKGLQWAYIKLDLPLPNPVMLESLARILNIPLRDFKAVCMGKAEIKGMKNALDIKAALSKIDLAKLTFNALQLFKASSKSQKDKALKRYVALAKVRDSGNRPLLYMLDKIPVLPPLYRPISTHNGLTMVADSNYLYANMLDARNDFRDAKDLPLLYQAQARERLYKSWQLLTGLMDPSDAKLKSKNVGGLLKWALGLGKSPKEAAFQRKVYGSTVDTVGRGVVIPDSKLKLNLIGMPWDIAWNVYAPFVTRKLVQARYTPIEAMKMVKSHSDLAKDYLVLVMNERPVVMNRAPSLHKYNLMGFNAVPTSDVAIHVNPSIVVPFNMDFDGDSIWNMTLIEVLLSLLKRYFGFSEKDTLTFEHLGVLYVLRSDENSSSLQNNIKENSNMLNKESKLQFITTIGTLSDLPHVVDTEVQKSSTVTEWDVPTGFYVSTVDPSTGEIVRAAITKVSKHTGLKMYDCTLEVSGAYSHVVTASEDHSLITLDPSTVRLDKTTPADAKGRLVPYTTRSRHNDPDYCLKYIKLGKQYPLSYDIGMFFGMMIGDGWVDNQYNAKLACCDKSLQQYILEHWLPADDLPFKEQSHLLFYAPDKDRFGQNKMRELFNLIMTRLDKEALGNLIGHGAENKQIPAVLLAASRTCLIGVLCGLLATDGHIGISKTNSKKATIKNIAYHTISPLLRDGIQSLCTRLGIRTRVTPYMGTNSKSTCYELGFCLEDIAALKKAYPDKFVIPVSHKEEALKAICADISKGVKNSFDIVPYPRGLFCEFTYAGVSKLYKATIPTASKKGYIKREFAKVLADHMNKVDWTLYSDPTCLKQVDRTHHTPEEAKALVDAWIKIVRDEAIGWEVVSDVTPSTCTEGWDCTVPGPYTFTLSTGTVVQDTVNLHVPVSQKAIKDVRLKMMPLRNLMAVRNHKIIYKPLKAYLQGLYVATRMNKDADVKTFNNIQLAKAAYRSGAIDIDTPIIIKNN